jgi:hypothetical protein
MSYHTYVVTNTVTNEVIVCCARSESAALRMGKDGWRLNHVHHLSALRVEPGTYVEVR